jgi:hypothetical protein
MIAIILCSQSSIYQCQYAELRTMGSAEKLKRDMDFVAKSASVVHVR